MNTLPARCCGLLFVVLLCLPSAAQSLPWELHRDGQVERGTLTITGPATAIYRLESSVDAAGEGNAESEAAIPYLHILPRPGERVSLRLGGPEAPQLTPLHMYRVSAELRRSPRTQVYLCRQDDPTQLDLRLPAIDYLIAPVWEEVVAFTILPDGAQKQQAIQLVVANADNGLADASVDLRQLRLEDLGRVVDLPVPRPIATWPRLVLADKSASLPRVSHDAGSGIYRLRFTIATPVELNGAVSLHQGDDTVRHWMTSTALSRTYTVPAGVHHVELLFPVADQRFLHQWLRIQHPPTDPPTELRGIELHQLSTAPPAAREAGLQTPPRR